MAYVCPYRHDGVELHPPGLGDLCAAALGLPHPDRAAVPINRRILLPLQPVLWACATGPCTCPTLRPTSPPLSPSACATRAGLELTHCLCLDLGTEAAYSDLLAPAVLV